MGRNGRKETELNGMGTGYLKCRNEAVIKDYENVVKVREVEENP